MLSFTRVQEAPGAFPLNTLGKDAAPDRSFGVALARPAMARTWRQRKTQPRARCSDWSMAARAEYAPEQSPEPEGTEGNSSHAGNSPSCRSCGLAPRTQTPSSCASPRGPWLAASAVSLLPYAGLLSPQRLWRFHLELLGLRLVRSCHLRTLTAVWPCRASRPSTRRPRPSARPRPLSTKPRLSELRPIRDSGP